MAQTPSKNPGVLVAWLCFYSMIVAEDRRIRLLYETSWRSGKKKSRVSSSSYHRVKVSLYSNGPVVTRSCFCCCVARAWSLPDESEGSYLSLERIIVEDAVMVKQFFIIFWIVYCRFMAEWCKKYELNQTTKNMTSSCARDMFWEPSPKMSVPRYRGTRKWTFRIEKTWCNFDHSDWASQILN